MGADLSIWRNSMTHLSLSVSMLSDSPSAIICLTETKYNTILARRYSLYCHIGLTSTSNIASQHNKIGAITFGTLLILYTIFWHRFECTLTQVLAQRMSLAQTIFHLFLLIFPGGKFLLCCSLFWAGKCCTLSLPKDYLPICMLE